jgi:D-3-phosphoglycerate dehydrogenase
MYMSIKVLLPQPIPQEGYDYLHTHGFETIDGRGILEEDIMADISNCHAMIVRTAKITAKIFEAAPKLKILARHGAGYDGVDMAAARKNGTLVVTAGDSNSISVAELAIFYMLYCSRNFKLVQKIYINNYQRAKMGIPKTELYGKKLGLIGLGNIGLKVAEKAALGFQMEILAYDPFQKGILPDYVRLTDNREEVFRTSDYVSVHVPATAETIHSISDREFSWMKPSAILINTSRGCIVDESALIRALENHGIAGAGLDVLEQEPLDPNNPLLYMDNVLTAPHIGGITKEASIRSSVTCAKAIVDYSNGRVPQHVVPEMRDMLLV